MYDSGIGISWVHVFQASHCHTQTVTNGNALCSLISFYIAVHHYYKILQGNVSTFM